MDFLTPKRPDGVAVWRVIYEHVRPLTPGTIITYEEILDLVRPEVTQRRELYQVVTRVNRALWKNDSRSLGNVKGVGYKLLLAEEHEHQAFAYKKQAQKKVGNAVAVLKAVDMNQLNDAGQRWVRQVTAGMVVLHETMVHHAAKLSEHEKIIQDLQRRVDDLEK